jgi:hypothetical protein
MTATIAMDNFANNRWIVDKWKGSASKELFSFATFELTVCTIWHLSDHDMLDANTLELLYFKSTRFYHTTNLSIFTFSEDYTKHVSAYSLYLTGLCLDKS